MFFCSSMRVGCLGSSILPASQNQFEPVAVSILRKLNMTQNEPYCKRNMGSVHGGNADFRKNFLIKKEYPVGPHKKTTSVCKTQRQKNGRG